MKYEDENVKIWIGDSQKLLKNIPDESISTIITSPPYNINKKYGKYNDKVDFEEWKELINNVVKESYRILKPNGSLFINLSPIPIGKDKEISADVEAKDIETLSKNKEFLLDVREEYEYEEGHVKGAVNLPLREILSQKDSLPKDRDIYVYCRTAHRSSDAVNFLKSLSFDKVHNVEGGFIDISFNEYHKDKGNLENSIVTNYNFD